MDSKLSNQIRDLNLFAQENAGDEVELGRTRIKGLLIPDLNLATY